VDLEGDYNITFKVILFSNFYYVIVLLKRMFFFFNLYLIKMLIEININVRNV